MSASVKLSSKLPGDEEINGLDKLADNLIADPHQVLVALVFLDVPTVTLDTETDAKVPTVRVRKIEPIEVVGKVPKEIRELHQRLTEQRLGRTPLPFDTLEPERGGGYVDELPEGE